MSIPERLGFLLMCIRRGFRFAVMQIKAVVFTLLRSFELSEPEGQEVVRMGM